MVVKLKFWFADHSEEDCDTYLPTYPVIDDIIFYKNKIFIVTERAFDLQNSVHKVHCKEKFK